MTVLLAFFCSCWISRSNFIVSFLILYVSIYSFNLFQEIVLVNSLYLFWVLNRNVSYLIECSRHFFCNFLILTWSHVVSD